MTTDPPDDTRLSAASLLDESVHRVRLAPPGTLTIYYVGALPFVLALLYFWADQGHSPDASAHGTLAALGLTLLFLWMKICQAVFTARLTASIRRQPGGAEWTRARLWRLAAAQVALQPSGLFVFCLPALPAMLGLPAVSAFFLSLILSLPFGWTYAFYQNVTVLGDGEALSTRAVFSRSLRHALSRPRHNHAGLGLLSVLAMFAWLNLMLLAFMLPRLAHMFTGEENVFTRSGVYYLFNTTFFSVTGALVYLALDPLAKAFYVLRCFYADSRRTGADLKSDLAALPSTALALAGACVFLLLPGPPARAATLASPSPAPVVAAAPDRVSAPALDRSIDEVLRRREYAWRAPRNVPADAQTPPADTFLDRMSRWWKDRFSAVGDWIEHIARKYFRWRRPNQDGADDSPSSGLDPATLRLLVYALIAAVVILLGVLAWRHLRGVRFRVAEGEAAPVAPGPVPDLTDDSVLANQLPEDEWLQLARSLLAGGDRRLALRAFYLSVLAGLGERGLLGIARHKSNRDYELELRRRARDQGEVQGAFGRNVRRFERVWYGRHDADDALLADFQTDRDRVLSPSSPG